MHSIPGLYFSYSPQKGRGVFCANLIRRDDLIEVCPVIVLEPDDRKVIDNTLLHNYYFEWGKGGKQAAIALGYGSLYNHSSNPNARFIVDIPNKTIDFVSKENIEPGIEITINYHAGVTVRKNLWFDEL